MPSPQISVIVPTINEAGNLPFLMQRVDAALIGRQYEILIVDDRSVDDTPQVCAELAQRHPLTLLTRDRPSNGLSGAVLHGIAHSRGNYLVVMDADLQHPPEKIPELLAPLERGQADFVLGSRYVQGGSTQQGWGILRKINSRLATLLARPLAGPTCDPMSGFFACKRQLLDNAHRLTPLGYKIALELLTKSRAQHIREIPIDFGVRRAGVSKLNIKQQFKYLEHLSRLYDFCFPRCSPVAKFFITTAVGWGVALALLVALVARGIRLPWAPPLAYLAAILSTAVFHLRYVRTQYEFLIRPHPWVDFWIISVAEWCICLLAAMWFKARVSHPLALESFVFCCGCATVMRYVLRKEFLLDLRGLYKQERKDDILHLEEPRQRNKAA